MSVWRFVIMLLVLSFGIEYLVDWIMLDDWWSYGLGMANLAAFLFFLATKESK